MKLLNLIDSVSKKAERRMSKTPFYQEEFQASREIITEGSGLPRQEIDKNLADRGLPSVMDCGKAVLKSLPILFPLVFIRGVLANLRRWLVRRQGR